MSAIGSEAAPFTGRTALSRNLALPVRDFLRTETGSAAVLVGAVVVALVWANVASGSYESLWTTELSIRLGHWEVVEDLRGWVNEGLMTFFFLVVGLEARREFDMGELRERKRIALPVVAALGGMLAPVLIYLAFNAGGPGRSGWGVAMSTDTALALGVLVLVGPRFPQRLRIFLLTLVVVDDIVALLVIAFAYTDHVSLSALATAVALFGLLLLLRRFGISRGLLPVAVAVAIWVAMLESGVDPVVAGLAIGLVTSAYPAARGDLERVSDLVRAFREQPTPELAREAQLGVESAISPNDRLQHLLHPWTSFLIVPLFALANAGIVITGGLLRHAATAPITLGIVVGYVVGKPLGISVASFLATRLRPGRLRLPVGWPTLVGGGAVAGVGFTVSLLIASLAFTGERLEEAKLGLFGAALAAAIVGWTVFRVTALLPVSVRARLLAATAESIVDLDSPVDPERDHVRGPDDALVTLVEFGDFECPFCGQAEPVVRELLADFGDDLRYVFRHLPLSDVHPHAQLAAEAAEAANAQGAFWPMHDLLLEHQDALEPKHLVRYAEELGLDVERFREELRRRAYAPRVAEDVEDADASGASGTPTFFVNGRRHQGAYDVATLTTSVRAARERARLLAKAAA
ncbi:MAG TPA: Na+/H+ antiporter NhaA [Gaiellaceae bacterium]